MAVVLFFATLSTVLCDSGVFSDGYLIPASYDGGVNSKTWIYGGIQPVHMPLFSEVTDEESHSFQLTVEKLEDVLQRAKKQGIRVRAAIPINPHHPLGDIYPAQLLKQCLELAHSLPDPEETHFMWGFGKFLKSQTFEVELELWQKLLDKKLLISPGKAFYWYEPGWFRMFFSDSVDIQRLEQTLHSYAAEPVTNNTSTADTFAIQKKILQANLQTHQEKMSPS